MTKRLIIDLAVCDRCDGCSIGPAMLALREKATFELVCRRCESASCILACPFDALERTEDGIVKRHNMRCVSCKSCSLACPFGTIYMELLPFYSMDYEAAVVNVKTSIARDQKKGVRFAEPDPGFTDPGFTDPGFTDPGFVGPGFCNALEYREVDPDEPGIHIIDDFLAARTRRWDKEDRGEEAA